MRNSWPKSAPNGRRYSKRPSRRRRPSCADANRQIENTIRTIRETQAEKETTRLARKELDDFRAAAEQADAAERDAEIAREIERIERRRQRRAERKAQRGEAAAPGSAPEPPKKREVEGGLESEGCWDRRWSAKCAR